MTIIVLKRSTVAAKIPATTDLVSGELAVNVNDGKLFLKKTVGGTDSIVDVTAMRSVAGRTGDVTLAKADVGLSSVDNTSDASKPVSTAQQVALDLKASILSLANAVIQGGAALIGYRGRTVASRLDDGVNVKDYGAKGDGSTDDTAAIQSAINASKYVYFPSTANGYRITSTLTIANSSTVLFGDGANFSSFINLNGHTFDVFNITAPSDVEIRNLSALNYSPPGASATNYWFIRCNSSATTKVINCNTNYLQSGVLLGQDGTGTSGGSQSRVQGCNFLHLGQGSGIGVYYGGKAEVRELIDCVISGPSTGSVGTDNCANGVKITGGAAIVLRNLELIGCGNPVSVKPLSTSSVVHLKMDMVWCDSSSSVGMWLDGSAGQIIGLSCNQLWASSSQLGVRITGFCRDVRIVSPEVYQNRSDGITIDNGADVLGLIISGHEIGGNTGSGISVGTSVSGFKIVNGNIGTSSHFGANANGVYLSGTNDNYIISNNGITGNTGSQIFNHAGGTLTRIVKDNIGYVTEVESSITQTTDSTGHITISHGLAGTPKFVVSTVLAADTTSPIQGQVVSVSSTTVVLKIFLSGSPFASSSVTVYYKAAY